MTTYIDYQTEFYRLLDKDLQQTMDSLYEAISKLNYYEQQCGFELPKHFQVFRLKVTEMLKNYDTI